MHQPKKHQSKRKRSLFDPDEIATTINQALRLDLGILTQEYEEPIYSEHFALRRQVEELLKKFCYSTQDKAKLEAETFKSFLKVNRHMRTTNRKLKHRLPYGKTRIQRNLPLDEKIHLRARALMHSVLAPFTELEWLTECKNSSGSSIGVPYSDTSQERKFKFPLSTTDRVIPRFERFMVLDSSLSIAIKKLNGTVPVTGPYDVVSGSRATTVDKTQTKRRMICVEPTCNMYLQQGLMSMMYKRMKKFGLDVETLPDIHQELARLSSITCSNATIDWSSASDCVSIELLRWLLPPSWFDVVIETRSDTTTLNGKSVDMEMISTMGNAVTFPLETLTFWTYAHACILSQDEKYNGLFPEREDWNRVSVFGDDCIVPTSIAPEFIRVMEAVGFIINDDKSYYGTEQFRESCGGDYLAGYDVRPYFLKAPHSVSLSSLEPWLYIIMNAFLKKYITYFGKLTYVYDKHLWRYLFSLFRKYKIKIKLVPSFFPDDAGLKLSYDILRFNRHYGFQLQPIKRSHHGTYSFNYCSFKYRNQRKKDDGISLALWLKKPNVTESFESIFVSKIGNQVCNDVFSIRRVGGYVVAKGLTCHWHVPEVNSGG